MKMVGLRSNRLALTWLITFIMVGCLDTEPVVKIGLVGPFEGRYREVGYDVIYSARLAVREINAAGGIGGYRVALVALDDSGDSDLAMSVASSMVIDLEVVAGVGPWLEATTAAAAPIYAGAGLPFINTNEARYAQVSPTELPHDFLMAYQEVTPFDEEAGPFAGPAYDAFQLIWHALADAAKDGHRLNREDMAGALSRVSG
jgi:ABC-type branched-subunit amino acid transport system substrate-binding protein